MKLTENNKKRYNWLYNYYKTIDPLAKIETYITDNKNKLNEIINNNSNWSDSSKHALYFMIYDNLKETDEKAAKKYYNLGIQTMKRIYKKEGENKQDQKEKENYMKLNELSEIATHQKSKDSQISDKKMILINLITLIPPLRTSFYTTSKIYNITDKPDKKENYIKLSKKYEIILNVSKDKISSRKGRTTIKHRNKKLYILLENYMNKYNYIYLFGNSQIDSKTLLRWLRNITGREHITINMIRSAHINEAYDNPEITINNKNDLADKMRHTAPTAALYYAKK